MENGEPTHTQNHNPTTITTSTTNTTIPTNIISPVPQQSQHHGSGGSVPVPVPGPHHHGALTLGLHPHNNNTVTVAVAVPQQPVVASARDDCWSEEATNTLIEAWGERYVNLNRGNLKQKHWQEVSDAVNSRGGGSKSKKTDVQCKNRLDTLKKKYKTEKGRIATHGVSRWPLYSKMDSLIGLNRKQQQQQQQQQQHQIVPKESPQQQQPVPLLQSLPAPPLALPPPSKQRPIDGSGSSGDGSPDSTQSCPKRAKRIENSPKRAQEIENSPKRAKGSENNGENPARELANAILKFGEVYERIEMTKQQQMIELEKHKMEFTKEIELQRMQMIAQTQLEIAKLENTKSGATEHYL